MPFQNIKTRDRRNNYGFTFGGPFWIPKVYDGHDKTFFFFNFEQYRKTLINNNIPQTVPTLAYREGDFRQALTGRILAKDPLVRNIIEGTVYDPKTERLVSGLRVRDPFPNNTIPKDRFDPVIEGYPAGIRSTALGQYAFSATETGLPSTLGQNLQGGTVGFPYAGFLLGLVSSGDMVARSST